MNFMLNSTSSETFPAFILSLLLVLIALKRLLNLFSLLTGDVLYWSTVGVYTISILISSSIRLTLTGVSIPLLSYNELISIGGTILIISLFLF